MSSENALILKRGYWLYAGTVSCEVRIVEQDTMYGTGELDDPVEIREDRHIKCCQLFFHTAGGKPGWAGGGVYVSLDEAVSYAESLLGPTLKWEA